MSSRVAQLLAGALLLLQLLTAAAQEESRLAPPAPDPQQRAALAVFRLKERTSCVCHNGGRCQRRLRLCECPLGFHGAHCELVDAELFARVEAAEAAKKAQEKMQREAVDNVQLRPDWLFYAALVAAAALLFAMLRVFLDLAKSYWRDASEQKKRRLSTCGGKADHAGVYTLPLPVQPPPYTEKLLQQQPHFVHSTPCCTQLPEYFEHII